MLACSYENQRCPACCIVSCVQLPCVLCECTCVLCEYILRIMCMYIILHNVCIYIILHIVCICIILRIVCVYIMCIYNVHIVCTYIILRIVRIYIIYICVYVYTLLPTAHTLRESPAYCTVAMQPHCNTRSHTATRCNTPKHTAAHCSTLQHTSALRVGDPPFPRPFHIFFSNPRIAECCTTVREKCTEFVTDCNSLHQLQRTAPHHKTLQHTATQGVTHAYC